MPILYSPDGQPVFCSQGDVASLLRLRYRTTQKLETVTQSPDKPFSFPTPDNDANLLAATALTGSINVNTATPKELATLPQVGTAAARRIKEGRPYRSVEDLIERVPEIEWLAIKHLVNLDEAETHAPDGAAENPAV